MAFDSNLIQKKLGYSYKNSNLLRNALTHSSYANEHKCPSNERLEFLGDSVLGLVVTEYLYKKFPSGEGDLSKMRASLVSENSLAAIFDLLGLEEYLMRGEGLKHSLPTKAMTADAMEAIIASIYIDGGMDSARKFILSIYGSILTDITQDHVPDSAKSLLQETFKGAKIVYQTAANGEGVEKTYHAKVFVNGVLSGEGEAKKKKEAEELAAKEAITKLKKV